MTRSFLNIVTILVVLLGTACRGADQIMGPRSGDFIVTLDAANYIEMLPGQKYSVGFRTTVTGEGWSSSQSLEFRGGNDKIVKVNAASAPTPSYGYDQFANKPTVVIDQWFIFEGVNVGTTRVVFHHPLDPKQEKTVTINVVNLPPKG